MKTLLHFVRLLAAVTFCTAHNLLRLGGFQTVRLAFAVVDEDPGVFEEQVLSNIERIERKQKAQLDDYDRFTRETKRAFEDLTRVKNRLNDVAEFETGLKRVQLELRRERKMAFGDPAARIAGDDELRARLNAAVRMACKDPAIRALGADMAKGLTQRTLTTGSTPGSSLITPDLANEIYDTLEHYGIWPTFGVRRLGTTLTKFPVQTARPVAKAVRKLAGRKLVEDTTIAGDSVDCEVVLWGILLGVERELLEDAEFDATRFVLQNFGEAAAFKLDQLCLTADGDDDENDDGIEGVFETGVAAIAGAGNTTIATTDLEDWVNCLTTVDAAALTRPCRWWMHPRNIARAILVRDLNGRPLFQTALEAPAYGAFGSILGYPVTPAHCLPSTNAASDKVAGFGDPDAHVIGIRSDFGFDTSDDFAFDSVKRMFRGLVRAGAVTRRAESLAILTLAGS